MINTPTPEHFGSRSGFAAHPAGTMHLIDNVSALLGDDLKSELHAGARLRIAASTFSIYAFEALKAELQTVDGLDFIFTASSFNTARATGKPAAENRQFFIPPDPRRDFDPIRIRVRDPSAQQADPAGDRTGVRRVGPPKVTFRSNRPARRCSSSPSRHVAVYLPLQGFTAADLGYERGEAVSNIVNKLDVAAETRVFIQLFDQIWHNDEQLEDVTNAVVDHIAAVYAENSPQRVYFLMLYNIFASFSRTSARTCCRTTSPAIRTVWSGTSCSTSSATRPPASSTSSRRYNGCILADSVGLGKTFTALAVIKYYELRNESRARALPEEAARELDGLQRATSPPTSSPRTVSATTCFATPTYPRRAANHSASPLDRVNWGNYDLVVIDESHNFRNKRCLRGAGDALPAADEPGRSSRA